MKKKAPESIPAVEVITAPDFVCDCEEDMRSACSGEPFYKKTEGKRYCVLHYPGKEKAAEFNEALNRKLQVKDYDFRGVWFPDEVSFKDSEFKKEVYFIATYFSSKADFSHANFSEEAYFIEAQFNDKANFIGTTFNKGAYLNEAIFNGKTTFRKTIFSDKAYFNYTKFCGEANFSEADFIGEVDFNKALFIEEIDFREAIFREETNFLRAKFRWTANFSRSQFRKEANFSEVTLSEKTAFNYATFSEGANFGKTKFGGETDFRNTNFYGEPNFTETQFSERTYFRETTFHREVYFLGALFSAEVDFSSVTFGGEAHFSTAAFRSYVTFSGNTNRQVFRDQASLDLQFAIIENPNHVSFHSLTLRPHWFINIDPRKFDFTSVHWNDPGLDKEIRYLNTKGVESPYDLLEKACRQLANNAEENRRHEEASRFRYLSMEALRKRKWHGLKFWRTDWLHMLYFAVSGYGERIFRALAVLVGIWLVSAFLYTQVGFKQRVPGQVSETGAVTAASYEVIAPLDFPDACLYSFRVMTLQKPEPQPFTRTANVFVTLETTLGPIQAALLALAIRRKFMR